jgi:hypothetical protein
MSFFFSFQQKNWVGLSLPAMLARMVASDFTSDVAIRFKIGRRATE